MVTFCTALRSGFGFMCLPLKPGRIYASVGVGEFSLLASASLLRALRLTIYMEHVLICTEDNDRLFSLDLFMFFLCKL